MFIFLWFHRDGMLRSAHTGDSRGFSDNLCLPTRWEKCNPLLYSVMTNTPNTDEHAWRLPQRETKSLRLPPGGRLQLQSLSRKLFTIYAFLSNFRLRGWWEADLHVREWQRHVHKSDLPRTRLLLHVVAWLWGARLLPRAHLQGALLQRTSWLLHQVLLEWSLQRPHHTTSEHQSVPKTEIFSKILENAGLKAKGYMAAMFRFCDGCWKICRFGGANNFSMVGSGREVLPNIFL